MNFYTYINALIKIVIIYFYPFICLVSFSSREELKTASSLPSSKLLVTCAFCCCSEDISWFKREIKSYGPLSKLAGSPSSNGIFRPYLETDSVSTRSRSPEMKDTPSSGGNTTNALPMQVGHFFRTSVQNVADVEELIWSHVACMDWSTCTNRKFSDNILMVLAKSLTQVSSLTAIVFFKAGFYCVVLSIAPLNVMWWIFLFNYRVLLLLSWKCKGLLQHN